MPPPTCEIVFLNQKLDPQPAPPILFSFPITEKGANTGPIFEVFRSFQYDQKTPPMCFNQPRHTILSPKEQDTGDGIFISPDVTSPMNLFHGS